MSELSNCVDFEKISTKLNGDWEEHIVHTCCDCGKSIFIGDTYYEIDNEIRCEECGKDYVNECFIFIAEVK